MGNGKSLQPIHIASKTGNVEIVEYILENVEDPQMAMMAPSDEAEYLPLHFAAIRGHFNVAKLLIQKGTPILTTNKLGDTIFHNAVRHGRTEFVC